MSHSFCLGWKFWFHLKSRQGMHMLSRSYWESNSRPSAHWCFHWTISPINTMLNMFQLQDLFIRGKNSNSTFEQKNIESVTPQKNIDLNRSIKTRLKSRLFSIQESCRHFNYSKNFDLNTLRYLTALINIVCGFCALIHSTIAYFILFFGTKIRFGIACIFILDSQ